MAAPTIREQHQAFDDAHIRFEQSFAALQQSFMDLLNTYEAIVRQVEPDLAADLVDEIHPPMVVRYPALARQLDDIYTAQYEFLCEAPLTSELCNAAAAMVEIIGRLFEGRGRHIGSDGR
jgi:hypothetical protein